MASSSSPWARHYQHVWEERSGSPRLPMWLRVAALAYGKHGANGHAPFAAGEVALALSSVQPNTGNITTPARQNVRRAIDVAMEYGFLAPGSSSRCLIVPHHAIEGGIGNAYAPCPFHGPGLGRPWGQAA